MRERVWDYQPIIGLKCWIHLHVPLCRNIWERKIESGPQNEWNACNKSNFTSETKDFLIKRLKIFFISAIEST